MPFGIIPVMANPPEKTEVDPVLMGLTAKLGSGEGSKQSHCWVLRTLGRDI